MARSSIGNNIQVTGSPAPPQSNANNDPIALRPPPLAPETQDGEVLARCNYCTKTLSAKGTVGMNRLCRHAASCQYAFSIVEHPGFIDFVEHPGFIDFMATTQPLFVMPGRQTVRNDCLKLFNHTKAVEMARMSQALKISLTTESDLWTASDMTGYIVVTGHYIDAKW
ncbi:hypothetical protein MJO28_014214 [Puccinia striiformis f. sp. tritici]|uniref:Uncharacterized protein n=1 Tax=Puccinia striiformis f. sp. tritici TaxID=168172 RepID=A0ACC0DTA1_9BASI|nr:hypothetical protein MJO28_014214 [Puccinia striiformis f. sp. tritici]